MSKTFLVTGGAGFIASNFIIHWMKNHPEDKIINLDKLTYAGNIENLKSIEKNPNYSFVHADICDRVIVDKLMQDTDIVVHFAAESHVDRSVLDPGIFIQTNIVGTQILLESALKNKIDHFHHISTDEVFGTLELNSQKQFDENTNYDPRSPYAASKASSDHLVRAYGETFGLAYTISNCSNNYGPLQFPEKLIPLAITNIMEGKNIPVYGDGLQVRDWLYVIDHCTAIEKILESNQIGETFLVGGLTEDIPNIEVVKMILNLMNKDESLIEFVKDRPGHDVRYSVDWSHIKNKLDWQPSVSFTEGLQKTIEWYQVNQKWWRPLKQRSQQFFHQNYDKR